MGRPISKEFENQKIYVLFAANANLVGNVCRSMYERTLRRRNFGFQQKHWIRLCETTEFVFVVPGIPNGPQVANKPLRR